MNEDGEEKEKEEFFFGRMEGWEGHASQIKMRINKHIEKLP